MEDDEFELEVNMIALYQLVAWLLPMDVEQVAEDCQMTELFGTDKTVCSALSLFICSALFLLLQLS